MFHFEAPPTAAVASRSVTELQSALEVVCRESTQSFDQIASLCHTLLLMLKSPLLYESPWLAASQVQVMLGIASGASNSTDAFAERHGCVVEPMHTREIVDARAQFIRSLNG